MIKASKLCVVIPNLNGMDTIGKTIESLQAQSMPCHIIVVENNSSDGSDTYVAETFPDVSLLPQETNRGFAEGVNVGIRYAMDLGAEYVALLNNDAWVKNDWLEELLSKLTSDPTFGIATCKLLDASGNKLDSTGEQYSIWGLPFPRGRGESKLDTYDSDTLVFGASGGASLYRTELFNQIGLFDKDFFAYYEDVDISFRAQLAGWKVVYQPEATAYHQIGATSSKLKGFTTYQTLKNLPMLLSKNVPSHYMIRILPRYMLAHIAFFASAVMRGQLWTAVKGDFMGTVMLFKSRHKRKEIQGTKKVDDKYIWDILTHDLPPRAKRLRSLRAKYRTLVGKHG